MENKVYFSENYYKDIDFVGSYITLYGNNGTLSVNIPISNKEYYQKNPTRAKVEYWEQHGWVCFTITSDHNKTYALRIHLSNDKIDDVLANVYSLGIPVKRLPTIK